MAAFASAASTLAVSTPAEKPLTCSSTADTRWARGRVLPSTMRTPATKPMTRQTTKPPHDVENGALCFDEALGDSLGTDIRPRSCYRPQPAGRPHGLWASPLRTCTLHPENRPSAST